MTSLGFNDVTELYSRTRRIQITRHYLSHPTLSAFSIELTNFDKMLGEIVNSNYWRSFIIPLKRIRFGLCAAPFTEEYRWNRISTILSEAKKHIEHIDKLYPDYAANAHQMTRLLEELLIDISTDPLLDNLSKLVSPDISTAWVIKESRLISDVDDVVENHGLQESAQVLHPSQLKDIRFFDRLVLVGPSRWFPEYIFTAPRSSDIHIVLFDWIKDNWKPTKVFSQPYKSSSHTNSSRFIENSTSSYKPISLDSDSLLIVEDRVATINSVVNGIDKDAYDNVEALCIFLEDDWVVFIEAGDKKTTLVIDLEEEPDDRIQRVLVKEIRPGNFILIRTGGGEDYIVPVADKILGYGAATARECQKRWKSWLKQYVDIHGLLETSIDLIDLGSQIANEVNVRNWISPRSIRTQDYRDFLAIMRLIDLENQADDYWQIMREINNAHRKAGFQVRDILLEQVKAVNVNLLHKHGKMDFKLDEEEDGGITAFRVENVLEDTIYIPYSQIGHPVELKGIVYG